MTVVSTGLHAVMPQEEITRLLLSLRDGADEAHAQLFPAIYDELCKIAHRQLNQRRSNQTLSTKALVHEAYLKLIDQAQARWDDRTHFFAVAAIAMRHILVDHARRRKAQKRGGDARRTLLDEALIDVEACAGQLVALDEALTRLNALSERLRRVVELRFFGGLSIEETATVLATSVRTVKRDWRKARAFLYSELYEVKASHGS